MAFTIMSWRDVDWMPHPSGDAGSTIPVHKYTTTDDTAAVETAGYFNAVAKRSKIGAHIDMTLGLGGTVMRRNYVVTNIAAGVVTVAKQNVT